MALIYALTHDGEIRYVGKTEGTERRRFRKHLDAARSGRRTHVCNWIRSVDFDVSVVVLEHDPPGGASEAEKAWIATLRRYGCRLTNLTDGGEGVSGYTHTEAARAKMAAAQTPEVRAAQSARRLGIPLPKEWREAISAARAGIKYSDEGRAKLSAALSGEKNPFYGKTHTEEAKAKMAASKRRRPGRKLSRDEVEALRRINTGRRHTDETKAKISAAKKGQPRNIDPDREAARREKIRLALTGKKKSPEHAAKVAAANRARAKRAA